MKDLARSLPLLALLTACGPADMNADEVEAVMFPDHGLLGGYDFGTSWDDVKANHNAVFELSDDRTMLHRKLSRHALGDGYTISFDFDDEGKLDRFQANLNATKQNVDTLRELHPYINAHYEEMIGESTCSYDMDDEGTGSKCMWVDIPGKPEVHVTYYERNEPQSATIDILIERELQARLRELQ